jgi:hypothetical protein
MSGGWPGRIWSEIKALTTHPLSYLVGFSRLADSPLSFSDFYKFYG